MNPFLGNSRQFRSGWRALVVLALLAAGLGSSFALVQPAGASVQDLYANAYDLTASLSAAPASFADTATGVGTFTRDAVEVNGLGSCGSYPDNPANTYSVWYTYTPPASGWLALGTMDPATNYDTVIEVWSGSVAPANSVACDDDAIAGNRRSELALPVAGGTKYIVAIRRNGASSMPTSPKLGFSASYTLRHEVYVDQNNGFDNNTGSATLPFRTIHRGVDALAPTGGVVHIVAAGAYLEAVSIAAPTTLDAPAGAVTLTSATLAGPIALSGPVSAGGVLVQSGGRIQDGVDLIATGGTVAVASAAAPYAENVSIGKSLTLRGIGATLPILQPASGAALTLAGGTVTVSGLTIQGAATAIDVTGGAGHTLYRNNIAGNTTGVASASIAVNAAENFWGDASGPAHASNPGGSGDTITDDVAYRAWCTQAAPACLPRSGAATRLVFTTSPGSTPANAAFAAQPVVRAEDDFGVLDTSFAGTITLLIKDATGTSGASLGGAVTASAVGGVADFSGKGVKIDYVGQNYQLIATSGALSSAAAGDSAPFDVTADRLVFHTSPSDSTAGAAFPTPPVVRAEDGAGHVDSSFSGQIVLAIKSGTGSAGATLSGTPALNAASGVATFAGLSIDKTGTAYRLSASASGLAGADSATFDVGAGAASQLAFTISPSDSTAGMTFTTQPVVEVRDAAGNRVTSFNGAVTLAIKSGTGAPGATLGGTATVSTINGVATFTNLTIVKAGAGYQLSASATSLTGADSAAFNIVAGPAVTLSFATSPSSSTAGAAFATQPSVQALDAYGNLATSFGGAVTLAIKSGTGTAGASLGGTSALNASGGVATFVGLSIDKAGTAYQLTASANGLAGADSAAFDIAPGVATRLTFAISPGNTPAGAIFAAQPVVRAEDALGNLDPTFTGAVTIAIKGGTGTAGAALGGTLTVNASGGVATFAGLSVDRIGSAYQLTASASGLADADSAAFNIGADRLVFGSSPSGSQAGVPFSTQPSVLAVDGFGTLDTNFAGAVTLAIKPGTGAAGATLGGPLTVSASGGVATFAGLNVDKVGTSYRLSASAAGLIGADSTIFDITAGIATQLVVVVSPGSSTAGAAFATQPSVRALDAYGNLATGFSGAVTLAIKSGTGTPGATLAGTATVNAAGGVADFAGLSIDKAGTAYQLSASAAGLTGANSAAFDITAGMAAQLSFTVLPSTTRAGSVFAAQPSVQALDAYGNPATSFNGAVTLAIKSGTGTPGATLAGTVTLNASGGVATFAGLSVDKVGTGYRLTASAAGLAGADSARFDVTASGLVFTVQPVTSGAGVGVVVKVAAQDASGNTDTSFSGQVTLALKTTTGPTRTQLLGTTQLGASAGVADFSAAGLNIQRIGANYVLTASAPGLPSADSSAFDITSGPAASLAFSMEPANTPAGAPLAITLEARDTYGNRADSFAGTIDIAIAANPGGGALGGTASKSATLGVVAFGLADGLNIDRFGVGYVLSASAAGLPTATSAPFDITASRLVFAMSPGDSPVGAALRAWPIVRAEDGFGTLDTTFSGPVALSIAPGTGTAGASLGGTATLNAAGGLATFARVTVDRLGAGYQLVASSAGLAPGASTPFDITKAQLLMPWVLRPAYPNLAGSFALSKHVFAPYDPVLVSVTITNTGMLPAGQFWVDFYVNPLNPPTAANQPWNKSCGSGRCRYGLAWYVDGTLAPGQSITLTSARGSYMAAYSDWPGYFTTDKLDLYLYVDSWNPGVASGAVFEQDERDNRAELQIGSTSQGTAAALPARTPADADRAGLVDLPARTTRPAH